MVDCPSSKLLVPLHGCYFILLLQVALANDVRNPTSEAGSEDSPDPLKSFASGSSDLININGFNSDLSYHDDDAIDDDDDDDVSGYDDNDDFLYDDDYLKLQAQFDNVDIPPGVEASVPWLKDPTPSEKMPAVVDTSPTPSLQGQCAPVGSFSDTGEKETKKAATSSSTVPAQSGDDNQDDVLGKYLFFKQFDTVEDFSDHHFSRMGFVGEQVILVP